MRFNAEGPITAEPYISQAYSPTQLLSPATQLAASADDYLGQGQREVGRRMAPDQVELFVAGDLGRGLRQQFVQHRSEFIALHDLGTSASLRVVKTLADALQTPLQRLTIRRQGQGAALAMIPFVELPTPAGLSVRIYSTDAGAQGPAQAGIVKSLLSHALMGVLVLGELPLHSAAGTLALLREAMTGEGWPSPDLLAVPLVAEGHGGVLPAGVASVWQALQRELPCQSANVRLALAAPARNVQTVWTHVAQAWNQQQSGQPAIAQAPSPTPIPAPALAPEPALAPAPATPVAQASARQTPGAPKPIQPSKPAQVYSGNGTLDFVPLAAAKLDLPTHTPSRPAAEPWHDAPAVAAPARPADAATAPMPLAWVAAAAAAAAATNGSAKRNRRASDYGPAEGTAAAQGATTATPVRAMPSPGATVWGDYLQPVQRIKGLAAACVFDTYNGDIMAATGGPSPTPERMASQGMALLSQAASASRSMGLGSAAPEISVHSASHHVLLRAVPGHPGVAVMLVLLASTGNITLARMHVEQMPAPT